MITFCPANENVFTALCYGQCRNKVVNITVLKKKKKVQSNKYMKYNQSQTNFKHVRRQPILINPHKSSITTTNNFPYSGKCTQFRDYYQITMAG